MDDKAKIRIGSEQEEQVDLSVSFTAACSLFVVMNHGMVPVGGDIDAMKKYIFDIKNKGPGFETMSDFERDKLVKQVTEQLQIAELCKKHGEVFIKELSQIIKELEPKKDQKPSLIIKPNWHG